MPAVMEITAPTHSTAKGVASQRFMESENSQSVNCKLLNKIEIGK